MPGLARSGPQDLEIFSGYIAKARHQADNYSYKYSLHLRRLSFAASDRLFWRLGSGSSRFSGGDSQGEEQG
jgi:hypothetical protein